MFNPFWRKNCSSIVPKMLTKREDGSTSTPITRRATEPSEWGIEGFDPRQGALIAYSGRGPAKDASAEPTHVSVWIWIPTLRAFYYTDLTKRKLSGPRTIGTGVLPKVFGTSTEEYAYIQFGMEGARQDGFNVPSLEKEGIYRIWEVHEQNANDAKAYAERWAKLWPMPKNKYEGRKKYSEYFSNTTFTESWNCASYAEKVLRSGGLNVSAGFFVTSPLELTTGQSRLMRFFNKTRKGSKDDWYLKSPPKSSAPRA